mmetsp:Transcript_17260/g.24442  ORF Transcript_17260/g.24442 Transcript_17260/m.24442 type:complete len:703 (+) Transcript_17260:17-2125(+)
MCDFIEHSPFKNLKSLRRLSVDENLRYIGPFSYENLSNFDQKKLLKHISSLLEKKLGDPSYELPLQQSIELLVLSIKYGEHIAKQLVNKELIVFIGNTGSGKSTLINYLAGCTMEKKSPQELGLKGMSKVIVVKSPKNGGTIDELMPIGHTKKSQTFMPQIEPDPTKKFTYCDCPGFLDNRGAEINIANAVNIKSALNSAEKVKICILVNYFSLQADRSKGLTDLIEICTNLFGGKEGIERNKHSILLGISKVPEDLDTFHLKEYLLDENSPTIKILAEQLFLYDPLDQSKNADFLSRDALIDKIKKLSPIQNTEEIFKTVLTHSDESKLLEISNKMREIVKKNFLGTNYGKVLTLIKSFERLTLINHPSVQNHLDECKSNILVCIQLKINEFKVHCLSKRFKEAKKVKSELVIIRKWFEKYFANEMDAKEIESFYEVAVKNFEDHLRNEDEMKKRLDKVTNEMLRQERLKKEHFQRMAEIELEPFVFGAGDWKNFFEISQMDSLPLPQNILEVLNRSCPYWPQKKVRETHLLVLIPSSVNGLTLNLNNFIEITKHPKKGTNMANISSNHDDNITGNLSPAGTSSPYWLLMTKYLIPGSRDQYFDVQKSFLKDGYGAPDFLEAVLAIYLHFVKTGTRLFSDSPLTYTRCKCLAHQSTSFTKVGGFDPDNLYVWFDYVINLTFILRVGKTVNTTGLAAVRKFN